MSFSITISSELEPLLKAEAGKAGLDPVTYAENLLRKSLPGHAASAPAVSTREADLLQEINRGLTPEEIDRYRALIRKRQQQTLTPEEFRELSDATLRLEALQANRLQRLAELARLRHVELLDLMNELGIGPAEVL